MNRTQFINLIKQYWKSNSEKSFEEIISIFIEDGIVISEDKAKLKIENLCKENSDIDNFLSNFN